VIVAPSDMSPAAKSAVARTIQHARSIGAKVVIVHAHELPGVVARDKALAAAIGPALHAELRESHALGDATDVEVVVREGAAPAVIVEVCEEKKADLVAIASTGRGLVSSLLLGGVTDRVVRTSHVPVLVLRSKR
jgi:nucleotide-binding universal stress UspA family protein